MKKKVLIGILVVFVILLLAFSFFLYPKLSIISGFAAKDVCSCVFVAGINEKTAIDEDINFSIFSLAKARVDYKNKSVTATVFGMKPKTAYYQGPTGCAMVNKMKPEEAYKFPGTWNTIKYDSLENWFTYIDTIEYLSKSQQSKLQEAVARAFKENDPEKPVKNTRAVVVLYKGQLVAEQYAPGFNKDSRLTGWSMTKSLTASMFSMLEEEGKIHKEDLTKIPEWQQDDRKNITWEQLLHMNSGLRWKEDLTHLSEMLFNSDDIGGYAIQLPLENQPDTEWEYATPTTNIIATTMRRYFNSTEDYIRYPYEHLFYKIGAYSTIIETDATGSFVGSSFSWATARDWAKFGQLYLQNGNWAGEQILSRDWVDYVRKAAPNSNGLYGAHFWLNKGKKFPDVPTDLYAMTGFIGQIVAIIPSKDMVIVRLGITSKKDGFDFNKWLKEIIDAVEDK